MPSSTKPKTETSNEVQDPLRQALSLVEKKVRNLEKRKLKLDMYKVKLAEGVSLEKDQLEAINKYGDVACNLEFAKELLKQFMALTQDAEKLLKKQMKKERADRILNEHKRLKQVLLIQNLLDSFGMEQVRNDFRNGWHSAVVLTEENLTQLDNIYKHICPSRDNQQDFVTASEHLCSLLDGKDKAVLGTTYKELKKLIDLILACGYFENAPRYDANGPSTEAPAAEKSSEKPVEEPATVVPVEVNPAELKQHTEEVVAPKLEPEKQPEVILEPVDNRKNNTRLENHIDNDSSFFTTGSSFPRHRPFQEIVSSVQGSFNFLQESTIDLDSPQHMDPAVVAAHPMPAVRHAPNTSVDVNSLTQAGFVAPGYDQTAAAVAAVAAAQSQQQQQQQQPQQQQPPHQPAPPPPPPSTTVPASHHPVIKSTPQSTVQHVQQALPPSVQPNSAVTLDVASANPAQAHATALLSTTPAAAAAAAAAANVVSQQLDYSNQAFTQNAISQNLSTDSLFHSVEDCAPTHSMIGQSVNDTSVPAFEIPTIPLPNQTQLTDGAISPFVKDASSQSHAVKKITNLNANAAVFQSMNANAAVFQPQHTDASPNNEVKSQLSPQPTDYNQDFAIRMKSSVDLKGRNSYSPGYFPRGSFQNRNYRGNRGSRSGLNNGFNRNSSGSSSGGSGGGGGGSRGAYTRSNYSAFSSGREYRTADNYGAALNGTSFGSGFTKRSSASPGSTGNTSSIGRTGTGSSGSSGNGGSMRGGGTGAGGAVRGQPRTGGIRGGRGNTGLGRPTFSQQTLAQ
ncbi:caprin-1 isoform X2 [Octopus sinensis]|uniref:Caprin-1 isoform X2 n=1 Tax=Octopus sinensis TaxID=2607531 RepID=A0A7E6F6P0_9MOLL|nr:caprin-1 isoform X2 [Octopus sinensis]